MFVFSYTATSFLNWYLYSDGLLPPLKYPLFNIIYASAIISAYWLMVWLVLSITYDPVSGTRLRRSKNVD
jgi:hypothetical protein